MNKDIVIVNPKDLMLAFPEHTLSISMKNEVATAGEDEILIRYEEDRELLFVDTRIGGLYDLKNALITWRASMQYAGPMQKRMLSGLKVKEGEDNSPKHVAVYDLSASPQTRPDPIAPRRGKQLKIEKERARTKVKQEIESASVKAHRLLQDAERSAQDKEVLQVVRAAIKESKEWYNKAYNMLSIGKRPRSKDTQQRLRRLKFAAPRVWCEGIDELIKVDNAGIHKLIDVYKNVEGKPKRIRKEIVPEVHSSMWVGRYEEYMRSDGTGHFRQLYIPVSILNSDLYSKPTAAYRMDPRFVKATKKSIGGKTIQCALFDLMVSK